MGEPAEPTEVERAWVREYAAKIVEATRNDVEVDHARWPDGDAMPDDELIFKLAQEIVLLAREIKESGQ